MEKSNLSELLGSQMIEECKYLTENVYSKLKKIKFTKEIKNIIRTNPILFGIYEDPNYLYEAQMEENVLLSYIEEFFDDINFKHCLNNKLLLFSIPIFDRLFKSKNMFVVNKARDYFFKIYCIESFDEFFLKRDVNFMKNFDFREICGIEHLMTSKDTCLGIRDTINFLSFVDFERKKRTNNNLDRTTYLKKLDDIYNRLYRYFSFIGLDETASKFDDIKNSIGNNINLYSKNELAYNDNNLKLIQFYYGDYFNLYLNKYFSFLEMENKMMRVEENDKRKNMLLASFCYSDFSNNAFYNTFSDIHLTIEDLLNFVKKYESVGYEFNHKQTNMLLRGFARKYFSDLGLDAEFEEERNLIRTSYNDFYDENFAFSDFEFIDYFNSLFEKELTTFSFDNKNKKLDYYILRAVIDNGYVGFEQLKGTKLYESLIASISIKTIEELEEVEEKKKDYRLNVFNKFYSLISEYGKGQVTLDYFIRQNVEIGEEEIAKEVFSWCGVNNMYDITPSIIQNTIRCIKGDFCKELFSNPYNKRKQVLQNYKEHIENDGVSDSFNETDLLNFYKYQVSIYFSSIIKDVVNGAKAAMERGENIFSVVSSYGVDINDFKKMILKVEDNLSLYEQYKKDKGTFIEQEKSATNDFEYQKRKITQNSAITIDNADDIKTTIQNGIVMPNGNIRRYTYFDLLMQIGEDIKPKDAWDNLFNDSDAVNAVAAKKFKQLFTSIPVHYTVMDLHKQPPFIEDVRAQRHTVKINGEDHLVTEDERECVIDFIEKNKFPICVYYDAIKSYLNGEFDPSKPLISHIGFSNLDSVTDTKVMIKKG